jgi:dihydroorotase
MIISDVIVCDVSGERRADVRIVDGKIAEVGEALQGEPRMEGRGAYLLPGIVDTNVRLKDGQLNGKNIGSVVNEARKGGVSRIVLAPDSAPSVDNGIVLEFVQKHRSQESGVVVETTIASTDEEERLTDIAILLKKGAKAPYMTTAISNNTACRIAEYVKMYKSTLFCKAQDTSLSSVGVMVEGSVATKLGLVGIPPFGEVVHVARMIEIARNFGIGILFKSIASPRSIELITKAKEEGVDVKCEVSLHHLLHSDEACEGFNTTAKLNPPLARREDMKRLQEALKKGQIDMVTLLHQPNAPVNKEVAFADAAYGCEAIAEAYSLYYTKLVKSGLIDMPTLVRLAVQNPAQSIGVRAGRIEPGEEAQLVLFDPAGEVEVQNPQSLYHGESLSGKVVVV